MQATVGRWLTPSDSKIMAADALASLIVNDGST